MDTNTGLSMEQLYRDAFPVVARTIARMGGDLESAKDIFHDALIIYLEKSHVVQLNSSPVSYLNGISRILWIKKFKDQLLYTFLDGSEEGIATTADSYASEQETAKPIFEYIKHAGRKCLELLQAFYYDRRSMQEIAEQFQFGSRRSATVQKYKCLEKVRDQLKTSSRYEKVTA